ncbi:hypothetical protein DMB95_09290 [Campylobacter sp. MIT 12-8780]|uniref:hypothetical protein n=1 Tax=unclassified Campylobacter TaxID=2593542 RepID=UPI0010FA623B|nr:MULTISPECIES: hypothetical protein [unclassified Campylobacter]NDJ28059.1 hypothetical protein [Campylobacter sp. MIT 19-121]TKX28283.1 hypothetical protein CQA38_08540 [Campylobacter sp. MIT 12-5580]TQR39975.1 hypothetical protein DMB95_09290 [Campylobacter sp. MIT 12-8780]
MALAKLDNSQYQNIVLVTNSALNYVTKDGETKQREPKTAALNIIHDAAAVEGMGAGNVSASFKQYGKWENFYINKNKETGTITLRPTKTPKDASTFVYINPVVTEEGKTFYAFNEKTEAGRSFTQGLSARDWQKDQNSEVLSYVEGRATLKNDELQAALKEKGPGYIAVISNSGIEIKSEADLKKGAQEVQNSVSKELENELPQKETQAKKKDEIEMA